VEGKIAAIAPDSAMIWCAESKFNSVRLGRLRSYPTNPVLKRTF
jgi:hypothetical protein